MHTNKAGSKMTELRNILPFNILKNTFADPVLSSELLNTTLWMVLREYLL